MPPKRVQIDSQTALLSPFDGIVPFKAYKKLWGPSVTGGCDLQSATNTHLDSAIYKGIIFRRHMAHGATEIEFCCIFGTITIK